MTAPLGVRAVSARLKDWLLDDALPLWWARGADLEGGGFFDRLAQDGFPEPGPKRFRVQARQAWVYAHAPSLGWTGPAAEACRHGLVALRQARREDGLYGLGRAAAPLDGMGELYDQAFALLAMAAGRIAFNDDAYEQDAVALRQRLAPFAAPDGGFAEAPSLDAPLFANPNMHLFESFQAWWEVSEDPQWQALAAGQARLALDRLLDPDLGVIFEAYGAGWAAPADPVVWPGHLYEWAWLLMRWPDGDAASLAAALRLIETAERAGVDLERRVAIFALDGTLAPTDRGARLWAQTERIKACALAASLTHDQDLWRAAGQAAESLESFLATPTRGLWRDWMDEAGALREEAAPASSFYHITGAIAELERLAEA